MWHQAKGWTQAELAEAIRIEPETLSRYEGGVRGPSVTVLALAAGALGTSLAALVPSGDPAGVVATRPEIARVAHILEQVKICSWGNEISGADCVAVANITLNPQFNVISGHQRTSRPTPR